MIASMTARIEGKIAYSDGSDDAFAVVYEDGQVKSEDRYGDAQAAFGQVWNDPLGQSTVAQVLAALGGTHTFTASRPAQPKTIKSLTFVYSGNIARTDGSQDTWQGLYDPKGGIVVTNASVYAEVRADASGVANLIALWLTLIGSGTVTIK